MTGSDPARNLHPAGGDTAPSDTHWHAVPLPGPLEREPDVSAREAEQHLDSALTGIELGAHDSAVHLWLAAKDPGTVATVASWLRRSWQAGVAAGRAEAVDETPTVTALRVVLTDAEARADRYRREAAEAEHDLRSERSAHRETSGADDAAAPALGAGGPRWI